MTTDRGERLPVPDFVSRPTFPFEGELRVRRLEPVQTSDAPRSGDPGGAPCRTCSTPDDTFIWVDQNWRVRAAQPSGVPIQVFLETRAHVDMDEMDEQLSAELGQLIVRLDRAIQAIGGVGRVHVARWGDGAAHFHLWFYARPLGSLQLRGFNLPMWAYILPPTPRDVWDANAAIVAQHLARDSGEALVGR